MDVQYPFFSFNTKYAGKLIVCTVVMNESSYDVLFDGNWVASVEHTDDLNWIQAGGIILPDEVVADIGYQIESRYL